MGGNSEHPNYAARFLGILFSFAVLTLLVSPYHPQKEGGLIKEIYCEFSITSIFASCDKMIFSRGEITDGKNANSRVLSEQTSVQQHTATSAPQYVTNVYNNTYPVTVIYKPDDVPLSYTPADVYLTATPVPLTPLELFRKQIESMQDSVGDRVRNAVDNFEDDLAESLDTDSLSTDELTVSGTLSSSGGVIFTSLGGGVLQTDAQGNISTTSISAGSISDDSLDFVQFSDALTLDASTDIAVSGTNVFSLTNTGTGNSFVVNDGAGDTSPFVIDANGNVGIGTSTPSQKLQVQGNLRLTGALYDSNNSVGTIGYILQTTGTGQQWVATSSLGIGGLVDSVNGQTGIVVLDTDDLLEGTNKYYTDARSRSAISESVAGLSYATSTGILSLSSGYIIPLSASTTDWNTAYVWGDHTLQGYLEATNNLSELSSSSTARANLGVDLAGTDNSTNVTLAGALDYITIAGQQITLQAIDLATDTSGILADGNFVKTGDWTGLLDGQEGSYYLSRANHTGTQSASTISDFSVAADARIAVGTTTIRNMFSGTSSIIYDNITGTFSLGTVDISDSTNLSVSVVGLDLSGDTIALSTGYAIPLSASTTDWNTAYAWGDHALANYFDTDVDDSDDIAEGTTNLFSQWDEATGGINYAGGNVGIGTTTPSRLLSIASDNPSIYLKDTAGGSPIDVELINTSSGEAGFIIMDVTNNRKIWQYRSGQNDIYTEATFLIDSDTGTTPFNVTRLGQTTETLSMWTTDSSAFILSDQDENTAGNGNLIFQTDNDSSANGYFGFQTKSGTNLARLTSAGNLGIGTTTPATQLSVASAGNVAVNIGGFFGSGYGAIALNGSTNANNYNILSGNAVTDNSLYFNRPSGGNINFREANGTSQVVIATGGNVGIGTALPDELLVASSSGYSKIKVVGQTASAFISDTSATGSKAFVLGSGLFGSALNFDNSGYFAIQSKSKNDLENLDGMTSFHIDGYTGNVGIGSTVGLSQSRPSRADLEVAVLAGEAQRITADTGDNAYMTFYENLTPQTYFGFGSAGDILTGALTDSTAIRAQNALHLGTAGDNIRLTIDTSGNVGIGTTTPDTLLTVNGSTRLNVGGSGMGLLGRDLSDNYIFSLTRESNNASLTAFEGIGFAAGVTTGPSSAYDMFISSAGDVGIGTSSPLSLLHVSSDDAVASDSGSDSIIRIENSSTADNRATLRLQKGDAVSGNRFADVRLNNLGTMEFAVGQSGGQLETVRMAIDANGSVGIGTSTPLARLAIENPTGFDSLTLNSTGTGLPMQRWRDDGVERAALYSLNGESIFRVRAGGDLYLDGGGASNGDLTVASSGNVGIGQTSPAAKLNIARTSSPTSISIANSYIHLGGNYQTLNGYHLIGFGYTSPEDNPNAYIGFQEKSTAGSGKGDLIFGTRSVTTDTVPTERMRIDSNGNIGVGTSTPHASFKMTLTGNGYFTNNIGTNTGVYMIANTHGGVIQAVDSNNVSVDSLILQQFGGNVGIGTTDPLEKLHVYGSGAVGTIIGSSNAGGAILTLDGDANGDGIGGDYAFLRHNTAGLLEISNLVGDIQISGTGGACTFTGAVSGGTCFSDERLKTVTGEVDSALEGLSTLNLVKFYWNQEAHEVTNASTTIENTGFLAQEVAKVFPELVYTTADGYKTLDYNTLSLYGIVAIKELDERTHFLSGISSSTTALLSTSDNDAFWQSLIALGQAFVDGVLHLTEARIEYVKSDIIETETLCVGDVCVTEEEFRDVFGNIDRDDVSNTPDTSFNDDDKVTATSTPASSTSSSTPIETVTELAPEEVIEEDGEEDVTQEEGAVDEEGVVTTEEVEIETVETEELPAITE